MASGPAPIHVTVADKECSFVVSVLQQMVLMETVVTGFVDEYPQLGLNPKIRFMTTIMVAVVFGVLGIPSTTQVVTDHTVYTSQVSTVYTAETFSSPLSFL